MRKKFTILTAALALLAMLAVPKGGWGQTKDEPTQIYSENFGSVASNTTYASHTDYSATQSMFVDQNASVSSHYTGYGKVGKNSTDPSSGYTGASGNSAAWFTASTGSNTNPDVLVISGINIEGYTDLNLSFGMLKKNGNNSGQTNTTTVTYQIDNGTIKTLTFTHPTTTNWTLCSGSIEGTGTSLTIHYSTKTSGGFTARYDDIIVTGTAVPTSSLATPSFDPDGGVYSSTQSVVINSTDDDVDIYYTTDGTDPSESSTAIEYTAPVQISDHTTLKAVATIDYEEYSAIATAEYKFLPTLDVVVPADNPTYVYNDNVQSFSWYVLSAVTPHGTTITEKGFVYSTTNNPPTTEDTKIIVTGDDLEATLTGLAASTSYYVRSYAISEGQTVYSSTATLTTTAFPTYDIQFVVNGEYYGSEVSVSGAIGEVINTQPAANLIPDGYTFAGWSTEDETISIIDDTYAPTDDMFLFAVFSITEYGEPVTNYQKMTATTDDWSGEYLLVCENNNKVFNGTASDNWGYCSDVTITNNTITSNETIDDYVVEINKVTNGYTLQVRAGTYMDWEGEKHFSLGETAKTYSIEYYSSTDKSVKIKYGSYWLQYNGNIRSYSSNQTKLQLYKKTTTIPTVTKQYTRIMDVTSATATMANIPVTYKVIVKNNGILTLTGNNNGTAANLIIEDGGQLITSNAVAATVQKQVKGFNDTEDGGWKMIASPVSGTIDIADVAHLNSGEIYKYDEPTHYWRYYTGEQVAAPFTQLANTVGYLYGNENDVTLEFAGTLVPSEDEVTIENLSYTATIGEDANPLAGWNLVGNPFACNAYTTKSYYVTSYDPNEPNNTILGEYAASQNEPIPPCTGILVQATDEDRTISFANSSYSIEESTNNGILEMAVAQQVVNRSGVSMAVKDKAMVSFNAGDELGKFVFNEDNAKLYIPQNGKDYAIVSAEGQGEMPVNFRASENGTYTLSIDTENVEMNYLHLIDNMTGMDVDLLQTPSYTFDATTRDYESRFRLVFAANNEYGVSTGSTAFAFYSNGNWIINNASEATLQVVDLTGRILSSETVNGSVSKTINTTPGVYMLRLINGENVNVQKIVVR